MCNVSKIGILRIRSRMAAAWAGSIMAPVWDNLGGAPARSRIFMEALMNRKLYVLALLFAMVPVVSAQTQTKAKPAPAKPAAAAPALQWGPAPAVFPAGAQLAVVSGDPSKAGKFVIQLKMPDGYKIAP